MMAGVVLSVILIMALILGVYIFGVYTASREDSEMHIEKENKDKNVINTFTLKAEHTKDFFKDFEKNPDGDAKFQTLYADNEYIYAIFNHDGWLAGEIQIFDWKGNKIKTVTIDLTINDKLQSAKGQYNVQNMVQMNGKLYIGVLAYGGNTGLYIYQINFN